MLIYKQQLPMCTGVEMIELPYKNVEEAKQNILHLEQQFDIPCMWYNVVEEEQKEFVLVTVGTGHNWGDVLKKEDYIGSLVTAEGFLVWHYFLLEREGFAFDEEEENE